MDRLIDWFRGKKTYLLALAVIAYQVGGHFVNASPINWQAITEALGAIFLRQGIAKAVKA